MRRIIRENRVLSAILAVILFVVLGLYFFDGDGSMQTPPDDKVEPRKSRIVEPVDPKMGSEGQNNKQSTESRQGPESPSDGPSEAPTSVSGGSAPPQGAGTPNQPSEGPNPSEPSPSGGTTPDVDVTVPGVGSIEVELSDLCKSYVAGKTPLEIALDTGSSIQYVLGVLETECP